MVTWLGLLLLAACSNDAATVTQVYPDSDTAEFKVFSKHCSQCHAPPHPDAHLAVEWPAVVSRMRQHIVQRGLPVVSGADQERILRYLESHAKVVQ
jgi:hypothetical protein